MDKLIEYSVNETLQWLPRLGLAILIVCGFWVLVKVFSRVINKAASRLEFDVHLTAIFIRVARVSLYMLGIVTALGTLGVNVSALVAGLGLTGFALGFALKDTISNLLSGVMILLYRPFKIGDRISIAGFEGVVVTIDLRYTELADESRKILIPNSKLFTDPISVLK